MKNDGSRNFINTANKRKLTNFVLSFVFASAALCYLPQASANAFNKFYHCVTTAAPEVQCEIYGQNNQPVLLVQKKDIEMTGSQKFKLRGTVLVPIEHAGITDPAKRLFQLPQADIDLQFKNGQVYELRGKVQLLSGELNRKLPLDALKGMGNSIAQMLNKRRWRWASIGYAEGSKLKALGAHTNDKLYYLYVSTDVTRQASYTQGDLTMSAETEGGMTFVFKRPPSGSYIYAGVTPQRYGASIEMGSTNNAGQDWGAGYSFYGHTIQYAAQTPLAMNQKYSNFLGNVAIDGIIPIKKLFMEIDGSIVALTPASDIKKVAQLISKGDLDKIPTDTKIGANGELFLTKSLFGVLDAKLKLGDASMGVVYSRQGRNSMKAFISGELAAGDWEVFKNIPVSAMQSQMNVSGLLALNRKGSIDNNSYLKIVGRYGVNNDILPGRLGDMLQNAMQIQGEMRVDRDEVVVRGVQTKDMQLDGINISRKAWVEMRIPVRNPNAFSITVDGRANMSFMNDAMSRSAKLYIDINGIRIESQINLPFQSIELEGEITAFGFYMSGSRGYSLGRGMFGILPERERPSRSVNVETNVTVASWGTSARAKVTICRRNGNCKQHGAYYEFGRKTKLCIEIRNRDFCIRLN